MSSRSLAKARKTFSGFTRFSGRIAPAKGLSHGGKITLLFGMRSAEEFSTLVHEIARLCGAEIYVALSTG